jgi:2-phospho-L-lactate/phosphoenolpyruvate guanylyltransferase
VSRLAAIIPVGTFEGAKSRLGGSLDAEERHDLVDGLLARTVSTALAVARLDDVLVISPDRAVLERASDLRARTLRQRTKGLRAGLSEARDDVAAGGADAVLVLPIDLPFVTVEAVDAILDALLASAAPTVILVTDRHGTGTNALAMRPPDVIEFAFGPGSRAAHRALAGAAGARYVELESTLAMDIDTPEDLVLIGTTDPERLVVG